MDRGAWQATVRGVAKELDTTEQLNNNNKSNGKNLEPPVSAAHLWMSPGFLEVRNTGNRLFSAYLSQEMKCCPTQMGCHDPHNQMQPKTKAARPYPPNVPLDSSSRSVNEKNSRVRSHWPHKTNTPMQFHLVETMPPHTLSSTAHPEH